jgi:hypothetical protein
VNAEGFGIECYPFTWVKDDKINVMTDELTSQNGIEKGKYQIVSLVATK